MTLLEKIGIEEERDACAIIACVKRDGRPSHGNVKRTLEALTKMGHRTGEIAGEGDGAGIQTDIPREIWRRHLESRGLIGATVEGKTAVIHDDMISTAGTTIGAVHVARANGAKRVYVCATHGVLAGQAVEKLRSAPIDQIAITDSIPLPPEKQLPNLKVISVAVLVANAIHRIHGNESISALFNDEPLTTK